MDANWDGLAVGLLAGNSLDVDEVLQPIDGGDFSFTAFVGASNNGDFVVFSDGDAANLRNGENARVRISKPVIATSNPVSHQTAAYYGGDSHHTLCFSLNSLLKGALIIVRRVPEGAP